MTPDLHQLADLRSAAAAAGWILPIQPRYVDLIRSGEKNCELRTYDTQIRPDSWVLAYTSQPSSAIDLALLIGAVEQHAPDRLWRDPGPHRLGVSPEAWQRAFTSVPVVWVHTIASVVELAPIGRAELTDRWPGWRPPQRATRRRQDWPSPAAWLEPAPTRPAPIRPVQLLLPIDFSTPAD